MFVEMLVEVKLMLEKMSLTTVSGVFSKVSQSNKLSLDPAYHLPNYVVHVFQSYYEKNRILGLNFRGHAILPFTMGITMTEN